MTAPITHNSRTTHGVLSESSLKAHDRKGREGKGRELEGDGKGKRVETSHHIVTYVPAESRDGMVTATRQEWAA